ncbi:MAG TPA: methyltransferase domain-containing protein [Candidatus Limnocylindrales bacterium]|nr:methyltransferase domain-containing protein [Candidatus Limnocylindrales bacterium]
MADLGTGDGRFVFATAAANPDRLVVGIDPVAAAMAEASRRAAAAPRKGGLPNALFVVATAEALPAELVSLAEAVTVNLPWGSLLRGALALDEAAARGIASVAAPGGRVSMLLAPAERDRLAADVSVEARLAGSLAADWASLGVVLSDARPATEEDLAAAGTTWARRLFAGSRGAEAGRRAWRLELHVATPPRLPAGGRGPADEHSALDPDRPRLAGDVVVDQDPVPATAVGAPELEPHEQLRVGLSRGVRTRRRHREPGRIGEGGR